MASEFPCSRRRIVVFALCGAALIAVGGWLAWTLNSPPQIGTDEEVFKTVDALFTAVTSRDTRRLDDCERRLLAHHEAGRLPPKAADFLESVIAQARSGEWDAAAKRLYDFMYGQRRETGA